MYVGDCSEFPPFPKCAVRMRAMLDLHGFEIVCYQKRSTFLYVVHKPRLLSPFCGKALRAQPCSISTNSPHRPPYYSFLWIAWANLIQTKPSSQRA